MESFTDKPNNVKIDYTGQIEEQGKQMTFFNGSFFPWFGINFLYFNFSV
jgi:hypothetical protein